MAVRKFHKNRFNKSNTFLSTKLILVREKKLIEINYAFLKCTISNNKLICFGHTKPTEHSKEYEFKVIYDGLSPPKVFVIKPDIVYNNDIHMFPKDNTLCLYHSKTDDFYWDNKKHHIHSTIIPWTLEWFIYYELYMISGKWEHPYIDHRLTK